MRIVLAGQRSFGAAVLRALHQDGHPILAAVSPAESDGRPDRCADAAHALGIPWMESGTLLEHTVPSGADLLVAAHSHDFIGRQTRLRFRVGAIGYHPSLLPRHRGRDAVRWTIHMGDPIAGGSVYWLDDGVDCGDLAAQRWCFVHPRDDASSLWSRELFPMGVTMLRDVVARLRSGERVAVPQLHQYATWEPSWERAPLYRPELPMIGLGPAPELRTVVDRDEL